MNEASLQVVLQNCDTYDRYAIASLVDVMLGHLEATSSLYGKVVLLKPNLISGNGPQCACTHSGFIAGVAGWFLDQGARVLVGDSPAFGQAENVCCSRGITEALKGMELTLVNFVTPVRRTLAGGVTVAIAQEALECDLFVGLPKIKAHNQMFVTMAVKNIFGIVKGNNKAMLHMVHGNSHDRFAEILLDLVALLPSQLHLADGIEVMHKSGPLDGEPLALGCLAAAHCPVALDTALLNLLQLDSKKSPLWRVAAKRRLAGSTLQGLDYPLLGPTDFHGSGFSAPDALCGIRFNPLRFLRGLVKRVHLKVSS